MKDTFVLFPRDQMCPCNGGSTAGNCCFRDQPPLTCDEMRFNSMELEAKLVDRFGRKRDVPPEVQLEIQVNQPGQIEPQIEHVVDLALKNIEAKPDIYPAFALKLWQPYTKRVTSLMEALYSCRYHEIQFLFRLDRVVKQEVLDFKPPTSRHTFRIHDRPLRIELESFLISTISSLDMLADALRILLGFNKNYKSYRKLAEHLQRRHPEHAQQVMADIFCPANDSWAQQVRDLRNLIVHEASFGAFDGVGHKQVLLLDAEISGVPAGQFVVTTWRELRELATRAIEAAPTYRAGFNVVDDSQE